MWWAGSRLLGYTARMRTPARLYAKHLVLGCTTLLVLGGCSRIKSSIDANPDFRKGAVDKARSSCVQTATANIPNASPQMNAKITSYCDCFATKGLAKFSNTELMEIGLSGNKMSPAVQSKLNDAVQMCITQLTSQK